MTFRYKDYADEHRSKTMTLSAVEFLRRFVQHVLPKGFVKVRHYGLLANRTATRGWRCAGGCSPSPRYATESARVHHRRRRRPAARIASWAR